jgi:two-component system, OmpR family, sensor histidine kinase BaeS
MRLHLWQRLFLAFAVLSGLALLGFVAWQQQGFRKGFLSYLDDVALQRLAPAGERLAAAYAEHGSWDFLRNDPPRFGELVEPEFDRARQFGPGDPRDPPPPPDDRGPPPPRDDGREPPPPSEGDPHQPPPRRAPPPRGRPDLMPRLLLLDAAGARVAGNPRVPPGAASLPIVLDGKDIGSLRLMPIPQLSGKTDLAFAKSQLEMALVAGVAVLLGALVLAFALARWLLAPVRALTAGTRALAAGDYSRRIATTRQDELGALARDFDHLAATLEQARDARRQWGADIAHELRTPLAILRGEIQALQDGVRAVTPQALDSLNTECERLGHLVEDLYLLALADAGALDYRFETLDLADLAREAVDLQQRACADAGLELEAIVSGATTVRGDARRLAQLLDNLLSNARRYTDTPGRIRVTVHRSGTQVRLVVEDTAPGVPSTALPHLFERLYRVDASRSRRSGGAGLGLAICRAIVDAHGGRIEARPSALGGLSVVVDLVAVDFAVLET